MDSKTTAHFVASLADRHRNELGFLPMQTIHALCHAGRVEVAECNEDALGYVMHGPTRKRLRIYQACIREDARRMTFGSQTLDAVLAKANEAGVHKISLWCAEDLPANAFWQTFGFQPLGQRIKSKRKPRLQIGYELMLPAGQANYDRLNRDGLEPTRERMIDMLTAMGATQTQADKFKRRRYG